VLTRHQANPGYQRQTSQREKTSSNKAENSKTESTFNIESEDLRISKSLNEAGLLGESENGEDYKVGGSQEKE
jgi:hypothetical protein